MNKPVIVLGNGGHAKVVCSLVRAVGLTLHGVTAPSVCTSQTKSPRMDNSFKDLPILGDDEVIFNFKPFAINLINGLGTHPDTKARIKLYRRFVEANYDFPTLIHPSALVDSAAKIGQACQIHLRAIIQPDVVIEENVIINTAAIIEHDVYIRSHCHIAPNATLLGGVKIGEGVLVGGSATILPGCEIGDFAIIGAGAVVTKDVLANTIVVGTPAR